MSGLIVLPRLRGRALLVPVLMAAVLLFGVGMTPAHALGAPLYTVSRTSTGLVASDPLNATLSQSQLAGSSFWTFGGDAVGEQAPYGFSEDAGGLHIGVQSTAQYPYAGFYALHRANAVLAHAVITAPSSTVPSGYPNVGLYVQTGGANVDYVFCGETTASYGTYWGVAEAVGNPGGAQQYIPLWYDSSPNQPLTRSCTIVTNGENYLAVYLDGTLEFQASNLQLGYQQPFQFFLETQTSYQGAMFTGTFQDFYLTSSDSITVNNVPLQSTVQLVAPSGQVLASATPSGGTATLAIGQFNMPLEANIQIIQLGVEVGSTSSTVAIRGGDSYSVSLLGLGGLGLSSSSPASAGVSSVVGSLPSTANSAAGATSSVVSGASSPSSLGTKAISPVAALSLIAVSAVAIPRRRPEESAKRPSELARKQREAMKAE